MYADIVCEVVTPTVPDDRAPLFMSRTDDEAIGEGDSLPPSSQGAQL